MRRKLTDQEIEETREAIRQQRRDEKQTRKEELEKRKAEDKKAVARTQAEKNRLLKIETYGRGKVSLVKKLLGRNKREVAKAKVDLNKEFPPWKYLRAEQTEIKTKKKAMATEELTTYNQDEEDADQMAR